MTDKLFDEDDDTLETPDEVTIPDDEPLKPFLEKYKDPKGIAAALVEKDRFINQLKGENAELRTEVVTRGKVDEALDRLLQSKPNTPKVPDGTDRLGEGEGASKPSLTEDDVKRVLAQERANLVAQNNLVRTKELLKELYGNNYTKVLTDKAKELGESKEFFEALAMKNPNAVIAMLGAPVPAKKTVGASPSGLNTTDMTLRNDSGTDRSYSYYQKLKKDNPSSYWSPAVQNQMHKDAIRLGEKFYSP